jgi:single-stranded DNA-binding protein
MLPLNTDAVLATDPKIRSVGDDEVCELFVFIPNLKKVKGGRENHPIAYQAWGKHGRACYEQLGKGSLVVLNGTLSYEEYTNRDGQQRSRWFGSGRVRFVRIKRDGLYVEAPARHADPADTRTPDERAADADIPF